MRLPIGEGDNYIMSEILIAIICTIVSLLGGALLFLLQKHFKKMERYAEDADKRRTTKDVLVLKCLKAISRLTEANSEAIRTGHSNGHVTAAKTELDKVEKELDAFILECAIKKVNKK